MNPERREGHRLTGSVGRQDTWLRSARWLLVPAALGLFALVGMAISTEDRSEYDARTNTVEARPETGSDELTTSTATQGAGADGATTTQTTATPATDESAPPTSSDADSGGGGQAVSFEVMAANGRLGVELGGINPLARPVGADGGAGAPVELVPGLGGPAADGAPISTTTTVTDATTETASVPNGAPVGLRLNGSGQLEPVGLDAIAPGDLVVAPAAGGVDVLRPDGSRVEVRPGDLAGEGPAGLSTVEVAPDGRATTLEPDAAGEIALGDGVTIRVPEPDDGGATDSLFDAVTSGPWRWLILGLVAALVAAALTVLYRRRRRSVAEEPFGPGWSGGGVPAHRVDEFLALLSADPDPGRAIRLAFSAAERGIGRMPPRRSTETPFEWYRRVAADHPEPAEHLAGLCGCFANARFAPAPPTAEERDLAVTELRHLFRLGANPGTPADHDDLRLEVGSGV